MFDLERYDFALQAIQQQERYVGTRSLIGELKSLLEQSGMSLDQREEVLHIQRLSSVAHIEQKDRPDGQPYPNHPIEVALEVVRKFGLTDKCVIEAALLHDTIEDQSHKMIEILGGSPERCDDPEALAIELVADRISRRVAELLSRLTNPDFDKMVEDAQLAGDKSATVDIKNKFYREYFLKKFDVDIEAAMIKLADFSQNALSLENLEEGARKEKLKKKYGPVILGVIEKLRALEDSSTPLYDKRESIIEELESAYAREYA